MREKTQDDTTIRAARPTVDQYRLVVRTRSARLNERVSLKDLTDAALDAYLPQLLKAEGLDIEPTGAQQ